MNSRGSAGTSPPPSNTACRFHSAYILGSSLDYFFRAAMLGEQSYSKPITKKYMTDLEEYAANSPFAQYTLSLYGT